MPLHACTIVARNYLPHARVLAQSFLAHNPGSRFTTLVIDDRRREVGPDEPFDLLHLDDLVPDVAELHLLASYYDVMELATAVKPLLLMHLLRQTTDPVAYIDPDIEVYADLSPVEQAAAQAPIVLTPHTMVPYPRDGLRPTEAEIMGSGIYNLGFIAVAHGAEDFLRWWWERLQRDAVVDPTRMLFTDQRWIDFVPGLFDHVLVKDPGLNVAYWNLHGRDVAGSPGAWTVDGQPLRFFHFSGYSPFKPTVLSKHTGDHPRVRLTDSVAVAALAQRYGERLVEQGLTATGGPAYGWNGDAGLVLDAGMRRAYREAVKAADASGLPVAAPDPFGPHHGEAFLGWLRTAPAGRRWTTVNRYLYAVHDTRNDLQKAFPEGEKGADEAYLRWAAQGSLALSGRGAVLALRGKVEPVPAVEPGQLPAVQAVGYFRAELGMGEYGRQLVAALQASGAPVGTTTWTETISRQEHAFVDLDAGTAARVNVVVVNADQTPVFARAAGPDFFAGRYTVGAWAWEVEDFPAAYDEALALVDEVWAISDFTRDVVARRTSKPVHSVPPPVAAPELDPTITRADLGLPDGFLFLFAFDYLSVPKRKNPLGVVEAFTRAFAPGEGPVLVVKSINGDKLPQDRAALLAAAQDRPDVLLLEDYLTGAQRTALTALTDCYVSLHRSEGLGYTMADAMALGKPVIATAYSGNMTFMDEDNSYLVPYDLVPVGPGAAPYSPTARWAEPRLQVAVELMRRVVADPEGAAAVGARAAKDIAEKHGAEARGRLVEERLRDLATRLSTSTGAALSPSEIVLSPAQRVLGRARFLAHVARTPEMRRAALRRRLGSTVSAGFGQSRRAVSEQEATRREVGVLRNRVELVARELDTVTAKVAHTDGAGELAPSLAERLATVEVRVNRVHAVTDLHARQFSDVVDRLDRLDQTSQRALAELDAAPYCSDPDAVQVQGRSGRTLGYSGRSVASYADFEDLFRGTEAFITERQRAYLPVLTDHGPVLDLGCGRG